MQRGVGRVKHFQRAGAARSGQMASRRRFVYTYVLICQLQTEELHNTDNKRFKMTDFTSQLGLLTDKQPSCGFLFCHCTLLQLLNCAVKCVSLACPFFLRSIRVLCSAVTDSVGNAALYVRGNSLRGGLHKPNRMKYVHCQVLIKEEEHRDDREGEEAKNWANPKPVVHQPSSLSAAEDL